MWRVYVHTNKVNGMKYVGRTSLTMAKRCQNGEGYRPKTGSSPFYDAIKEYGWSNFSTKVLYSKLTAEEALKLEKTLIRNLESHISTGKGYNTDWKGEKFTGRYQSEEVRKRISEANKGNTHSEETKNKIRESRKGKTQSYETRLKIGVTLYKKKNPNCTDEEAIEVVKLNMKQVDQRKINREERKKKFANVKHKVEEVSKEEGTWVINEAESLYAKYYENEI